MRRDDTHVTKKAMIVSGHAGRGRCKFWMYCVNDQQRSERREDGW